MTEQLEKLIANLHDAPTRCVLVMTGGGAHAAANLLVVPGASRTVLEAVVPYDARSLAEFLGAPPDQACSLQTARAMAARAYERAVWLAPGEQVVGMGATASLATDRPKKGDHRFHVACKTAQQEVVCSLTLSKGARSRSGEEELLNRTMLNALAEAFGISERVEVPLVEGEGLQFERSFTDPFSPLLAGHVPLVLVEDDGRIRLGQDVWHRDQPQAILPGSFNPMHRGHLELARLAERHFERRVIFELSVENVDKPPLELTEIRRRVAQFAWRAPLFLTRSPTFVEKARLFPGALFVVGADTATRIVDPKYYDGAESGLLQALSEMRASGCRFAVAGRHHDDGNFLTLDDLSIPEGYSDLFVPIRDFAIQTSSTALRAQSKSAATNDNAVRRSTPPNKPSDPAQALLASDEDLTERLRESVRRRPFTLSGFLIALLLVAVPVGVFVWMVYPRPEPPTLAVIAYDDVSRSSDEVDLRAQLTPLEAGTETSRLSNRKITFERAVVAGKATKKATATTDKRGKASVDWLFDGDASPAKFVARYSGKHPFHDYGQIWRWPADTSLVLVDVQGSLADAETTTWKNTNLFDIPVKPGTIKALNGNRHIVYLALEADTPLTYSTVRKWIHVRFAQSSRSLLGPVLARTSFNEPVEKARVALLERLRKKFTGSMIAIVQSGEAAEAARRFQIKTIVLSDARVEVHGAIVCEDWGEVGRHLADH